MFVSDHESKAALLWSSFKNRMGITSSPIMHFDLSSLVQTHTDLSELVQPFTTEEIDMVIKHIPVDKAPGPDGFNGMFLKKCWNIIKEDIYKLIPVNSLGLYVLCTTLNESNVIFRNTLLLKPFFRYEF